MKKIKLILIAGLITSSIIIGGVVTTAGHPNLNAQHTYYREYLKLWNDVAKTSTLTYEKSIDSRTQEKTTTSIGGHTKDVYNEAVLKDSTVATGEVLSLKTYWHSYHNYGLFNINLARNYSAGDTLIHQDSNSLLSVSQDIKNVSSFAIRARGNYDHGFLSWRNWLYVTLTVSTGKSYTYIYK